MHSALHNGDHSSEEEGESPPNRAMNTNNDDMYYDN